MKCPSCCKDIKKNIVYCPHCDEKQDKFNPKQGKNLYWTYLVILVLLPGIYRLFALFTRSQIQGYLHFDTLMDLVMTLLLFIIFMLFKAGKFWARYIITGGVILTQLLYLTQALIYGVLSTSFVRGIITSLILIVIAIDISRSKVIRAYIIQSSNKSA